MERPCILPALLCLENYCIDLSSSKLFRYIVIKTKRKEFLQFCKNLIICEIERHAKPLMIEIMLVYVSTEKDPGLIQFGSTLPSARAICRFLKNFQKQMFCAAL